MAGGHSHDQGDLGSVAVAARSRMVLLGLLALVAVATVVGVFQLWPDSKAVARVGSDVQFAAPGVTFPHAEVTRVLPPCDPGSFDEPPAQGGPTCGQIDVTVTSGPGRGQKARVQVSGSIAGAGLTNGDSVQLMRLPESRGVPASAMYSFFGVDRTRSLSIMTVVFVLIVLAVARLRGLMALVGLVFSGLVLVKFMLPALLVGESGLAVALVGAAAIMFVVLYLAHGPSLRTSTALAGTLVGIGITALVAQTAVGTNRLSGVGDETGAFLTSFVGDLNFQGLLTCAIIVAGLGVLNDVTITQSSAVWELRAAAPDMPRLGLFRSAMRIGRDHIASTIYTIVFAYAGAALSVLLLLFLYDRPVLDLLGTEDIAGEVVRTLSSAIGLVLAVPITTAIAALTVSAGAGPGVAMDSSYTKPTKRRHNSSSFDDPWTDV
jgi:uncharacterized membrane protein